MVQDLLADGTKSRIFIMIKWIVDCLSFCVGLIIFVVVFSPLCLTGLSVLRWFPCSAFSENSQLCLHLTNTEHEDEGEDDESDERKDDQEVEQVVVLAVSLDVLTAIPHTLRLRDGLRLHDGGGT